MTDSPHDDDEREPANAPADAASFIRRHAGEYEPDLTAAQRDLLGRVIARRIARGAKLDLIARAAATALPELVDARARRLGRDETLRARAWEDLARLRASGVSAIAISAAPGACHACRAATSLTPQPLPLRGEGPGERFLPAIPIVGCTHVAGCRCRYIAASDTPPASLDTAGDVDAVSASPLPLAGEGPGAGETVRPWYRPRPPRPHGPRWTEAERAARRPTRPIRPAPPKRRPHS